VLSKGEQMRLNYRVVLYEGAFDAAITAEMSTQFAGGARPELE
jgi:hypothetical protein